MKKLLTLPNLLTLTRMAGGLALFFLPPVTPAFFMVYTVSGVSDGLDGFAARRLGLASEFGAKLDSASDLIFFSAMLLRVLPLLWAQLPTAIWYFVGAILLIRMGAYLAAALKYRRFASLHTWMNKLTGFSLFFLPYLLGTGALLPYSAAVCLIAGLGSAEELLLHLTARDYDPNRKSIIQLLAQ